MPLYLYDNKLLLNNSKLATSSDCCCIEQSEYCDVSCTEQLFLELSGWTGGSTFCTTSWGNPFPGSFSTGYFYDNLNGVYSTSILSWGANSVEGIFRVGVEGSPYFPGILIKITTKTDFTSGQTEVYEYYVHAIVAGLYCTFDDELCIAEYTRTPSTDLGSVLFYVQIFRDGVFAFSTSVGANDGNGPTPSFSDYTGDITCDGPVVGLETCNGKRSSRLAVGTWVVNCPNGEYPDITNTDLVLRDGGTATVAINDLSTP